MPVLCEGTRGMTSAASDCTSEREENCFDFPLMSNMGDLQQLGDPKAANARHFFPVAINFLNWMEAPTPARAAAGTAGINDGPSQPGL